ncbi:metalloregulator ArsR/SmtB family transcription factor [Pseudohongiella acticola]|jgi:DNA-binding transcriptional ArsR family regulator|uniref:ArsR/SmtB family transcription factor n=1 Tax=Pseudohongiella acticola TaxID=1524254 RepID=UPI0030EEC9DE
MPESSGHSHHLPELAVPVFAALADPTRLALLSRLQDGQPHAIVDLTEGSGLSRQAISKHLTVLHDAGLVESRRQGRESRYLFRPQGMQQARSYLDRVAQQWDDAIDRLKAFVE